MKLKDILKMIEDNDIYLNDEVYLMDDYGIEYKIVGLVPIKSSNYTTTTEVLIDIEEVPKTTHIQYRTPF